LLLQAHSHLGIRHVLGMRLADHQYDSHASVLLTL